MLQAIKISKKYSREGAKSGYHDALSNVSAEFKENCVYALVGESGSGKSTLARILSFIEFPTSGHVLLDGTDIKEYSRAELRKKRSDIQLVMQDAESSLDPRQRITDILDEPLIHLANIAKGQRAGEKERLLQMVGLSDEILLRLPKELSGGQQKRICIARALAANPKLIIFDESFSGLDVTLRKQILDLLKELRTKLSCGYLIITHDLDVAMYMAEHILVMKNGEIVDRIINPKGFEDFTSPYAGQLVKALLSKRHALQ